MRTLGFLPSPPALLTHIHPPQRQAHYRRTKKLRRRSKQPCPPPRVRARRRIPRATHGLSFSSETYVSSILVILLFLLCDHFRVERSHKSHPLILLFQLPYRASSRLRILRSGNHPSSSPEGADDQPLSRAYSSLDFSFTIFGAMTSSSAFIGTRAVSLGRSSVS